MNIEDQVRDALGEYRTQSRPSPELWERIEASTARGSRAKTWALAAAAAVVVVFTVTALATRVDDGGDQVAAGGATREQFVQAAERSCVPIRARLESTQPVFHTQTAYSVVADQLEKIARDAIADAESFPIPPDVRSSNAANLADLRAALVLVNDMRTAVAANDLSAADAAISGFYGALNRVDSRLQQDGASACSPVTPPEAN